MFNVGGPEVLIILVVALVVLGPTKLPEAARQVGKAVTELRRMSSGFSAELRDALNEPVDTTPQPPSPLRAAEAIPPAHPEPDESGAGHDPGEPAAS